MVFDCNQGPVGQFKMSATNHRHNLLISISNQYDHYLQIDMCSVEDQKRVTGSINTCLLMS